MVTQNHHKKMRRKFLVIIFTMGVLITINFTVITPPVKFPPPGLNVELEINNEPTKNSTHLTVLTANVGNSNLGCFSRYRWHLCFNDVESRIAAQLATLRPDIVVLQELTHPDQCGGVPEQNINKVCFGWEEDNYQYQIRRLLGDNYTVACDPIYHRECVAVHVEIGTIVDCPIGSYCENIGWSANAHPDCNDAFVIFGVDIAINETLIRVINAHPENRNVDVCRTFTMQQIFETVGEQPPLANGVHNLLMGDFNMDPFRSNDSTAQLWHTYVGMPGSDRPFIYHSGPAEQWPPYDTFQLGTFRRILDFVVSDFAEGNCNVLGVTPGTQRLDEGKGMDHKAIFCQINFVPDI